MRPEGPSISSSLRHSCDVLSSCDSMSTRRVQLQRPVRRKQQGFGYPQVQFIILSCVEKRRSDTDARGWVSKSFLDVLAQTVDVRLNDFRVHFIHICGIADHRCSSGYIICEFPRVGVTVWPYFLQSNDSQLNLQQKNNCKYEWPRRNDIGLYYISKLICIWAEMSSKNDRLWNYL